MLEIDNFFLKQPEPLRGCLLALKEIILSQDENIACLFKYGGPFFYYKGKMFCYLWIHKKYKQPYLGMVEGKHLNHPLLIKENRTRIKIMLIDPQNDLPIKTIRGILKSAIAIY